MDSAQVKGVTHTRGASIDWRLGREMLRFCFLTVLPEHWLWVSWFWPWQNRWGRVEGSPGFVSPERRDLPFAASQEAAEPEEGQDGETLPAQARHKWPLGFSLGKHKSKPANAPNILCRWLFPLFFLLFGNLLILFSVACCCKCLLWWLGARDPLSMGLLCASMDGAGEGQALSELAGRSGPPDFLGI